MDTSLQTLLLTTQGIPFVEHVSLSRHSYLLDLDVAIAFK